MNTEEKILNKLSQWLESEESNNLSEWEFEVSTKPQKADDVDAWFDAQISGEMSDDDYEILENEFLGFSSTGEGGEYYLWDYPNREGPAPIIFLGSSGEYDVVAASLNDFVCMLGHGKVFSADYETLRVTWEDYNDEDQADYTAECKKFIESLDGLIEATTFKQAIKNIENQKSFIQVVDDFVKKYS